MKTAACLLALLLLSGCHPKEDIAMEIPPTRTVTFVNAVREADAWILPRTPAILKTTVWGTPTVPKAKPGESRPAPLGEPGDDGLLSKAREMLYKAEPSSTTTFTKGKSGELSQ